MRRLIRKDNQGNWHLKGVPWERLRAGADLDERTRQRLYGALCKLLAYEDTGLEPAAAAPGGRHAGGSCTGTGKASQTARCFRRNPVLGN